MGGRGVSWIVGMWVMWLRVFCRRRRMLLLSMVIFSFWSLSWILFWSIKRMLSFVWSRNRVILVKFRLLSRGIGGLKGKLTLSVRKGWKILGILLLSILRIRRMMYRICILLLGILWFEIDTFLMGFIKMFSLVKGKIEKIWSRYMRNNRLFLLLIMSIFSWKLRRIWNVFRIMHWRKEIRKKIWKRLRIFIKIRRNCSRLWLISAIFRGSRCLITRILGVILDFTFVVSRIVIRDSKIIILIIWNIEEMFFII